MILIASHTSTPAARNRAINKHLKEKYDRIQIRYKKDSEQKQKITEHAAKMGESVQAFIQRAIREAMENDNKKMQS